MAGLAGVLGIKELLALLDLRRRIAGERQGITIHRRTLIDGHDVVGLFVDFRVCQIELWHSPNERWSQRIRVLEELHEPLALNRAAFPAEEGSSVQRQWLVEFLKNPNTLR